jgi:hypothetical protein
MAKPIFIIRMPVSALETMGGDKLTQITKDLQTQLHDYHVLLMVDNRVDTAKFECFNVEHLDAITVAEMKEQIINAIDQLK